MARRGFPQLFGSIRSPRGSAISLSILLSLVLAARSDGQLRMVTYNTDGQAFISAGVTGNGPTDRIDTVLKAIGQEIGNDGQGHSDGIAKPIDVLMLQEQDLPAAGAGGNAQNASPTTQAILNLLNTAYNGQGVTYAMSNRTGTSDGAGSQTLIYRTQTVQLIADTAFGYVGQDRQTTRFQLRPVGYTSAADFYVYNSHYKASTGTANADKRNLEAQAIRANSDAIGEGTHAIYSGDHNFYAVDSTEPAWATLAAAGPGQANDPANKVGNWSSNSSFAAIHSQSPCVTGVVSSTSNCFAGSGMDDRFDFQLVTGEFLDGAGLSYITNSYHSFGNNGTTFNTDINNASNTVPLTGVTSYTKAQVLSALHTVSDHLPVIADYQVPAIMQAIAAAIPSSIDLGSSFNLNLTVSDSANVVTSNGADVLHYSVNTSGSASGSFLNQSDAALGGSNTHSIALNTSSVGLNSATITVTSTNQAIPVSTITIPLSFLIVLPGDYNGNGVVDAADYVVWRKNAGLGSGATYSQGDGNRDGSVGQADYDIWRVHFGQTAAGFGAGSSLAAEVPEPSCVLLAVLGVCLVLQRRTRLKAWTRLI